MAHSKPGWHPEDIKATLRKRYGGICRLSESWGLHRSAISQTLAKDASRIPVERRIAKALNLHPHILWPDRWAPDGSPLPRSAAAKPARKQSSTHRQNRIAA